MSFLNKYPYTDFHELNLDWILEKMRELGIRMDQFEAINQITFSGYWDITAQYPAWTVVENNDIGYISIQPVPAGILITNTDYWVVIVDYSADLAGMRADIAALQGDVSVINNEFARRYTVTDRHFIIGSDSYGTPGYGNWVGKVATLLGVVGDYIDCAVDGSSFTNATDSLRWLTILQNRTASLTAEQKAAITDIVFCGGINDSLPVNEFTQLVSPTEATVFLYTIQCILDFADYCKTEFPNAVISLGFIGNTVEQIDRRQYHLVARSIWAWQEACGRRNNLRFIDNMQYIMHDYQFMSNDSIHPTTAGGDTIAERLANWLMGGDVCFDVAFPDSDERYTTLLPVGSAPNLDARITHCTPKGTGHARITNNMVDVYLGNQLGIIFNNNTTPVTMTNNTSYCVGELQYKQVVYGKGLIDWPVEVVYWDRSNGDTPDGHYGHRIRHARIRLEQGCIWLDVKEVDDDFLVSSIDVTQMSIILPHFVYNTMFN